MRGLDEWFSKTLFNVLIPTWASPKLSEQSIRPWQMGFPVNLEAYMIKETKKKWKIFKSF